MKTTTSFERNLYSANKSKAEAFKKVLPGESKQRRLLIISQLSTPLGVMIAGAVEEGICLLEYADPPRCDEQIERIKKMLGAESVVGSHALLLMLADQMSQYFSGNRTAFDLPLVLVGTAFQKRVWEELRRIPYGQTQSYQQQAEKLGLPTAVRAVARANGDNRIAIVIPCHRVVGKDGKLTGYGGGLWRKEFLLRHERENLAR